MQAPAATVESRPFAASMKRAVVLLVPIVVVGIWMSMVPAGLLGKADAIGYAVCHRIDLRSFHLGDRPLPLCSRCSGMYLGAVLALGFLAALGKGRSGGYPVWRLLAPFGVFALAFAVDGLNSYLSLFPGAPHLYPPNNILRLITGTGMGLAMGMVVYPGFQQSMWRDWRPTPVLRSWLELAGLLILAAALVGAVLTENPLILYPLALISSLGVLGLLTAIYSILLVTILRRENRAASWRDLVGPLSGGLTLAVLQIALIDLGRYWITGTWSGFHLG